ncbi:hypothetical protein GCM10009780_21100 [Actinomadura alba]
MTRNEIGGDLARFGPPGSPDIGGGRPGIAGHRHTSEEGARWSNEAYRTG